MDVQLQIRQNALEAQQYMQDLFDWERRVKEKERGLSSGKASGSSMPAPRGRAASQVAAAPQSLQQPGLTANTKSSSTGMKSTGKSSNSMQQQQQQQQQNGGSNNTAAKHTYASYSKWDKLDVDAMLVEDSDEDTNHRSKASKSTNQSTAKAAPDQHPSALKPRSSAAAPLQAPGSNAAAKAVPAARLPPSAQIQLPNSSGSEEVDSSTPSQPHLTPISSTYTPPPGTSSSSNQGAAAPLPAEPSHPPIRNSEPQTSEAWRTRGNDLFKAGQHAYAKECYTRSIALDPTSATAYANRAMAELRLMEWPQAEEDCSYALKLEPNHVKALHRRGTARRRMGNTFGAAQDFEHALRMEPGNASLAKERDAAVDAHLAAAQLQMPSRRTRLAVHAKAHLSPPPQLTQQQQQHPNATATARTPPASTPPTTQTPAPPTPPAKAPPPKPGLVAAAQKLDGTDGPEFPLEAVRRGVSNGQKSSPSESSQRGGTSTIGAAPSAAAPPPPPAVAAQPAAAPATPAPAAAQPAAAPATPAPAPATPAARPAPPAAARAGAVPPSVPPAGAHAQNGGAAEGEEGAESRSQGAAVATASAEQQARTNKVAAAAAAAASQLHARTLASVRSPPRTSTEFEAVWRSLKGDQVLQARYLGVIPPETLPTVFKASLTPQLLAGILRSLLGCLNTPHHPTSAVSQQDEVPQNTMHLGQADAIAAMGNGGSQAAMEGRVGGKVLDAGYVGALLCGLSKVPRLSMAAMCMPTRERAELRGLWEHARQQAEGLGAHNDVGRTGSVDQRPLSEPEWEALRTAFKL